MKTKLFLGLALALSANVAWAFSVDIRVTPNPPPDWNLPVSVRVTDANFGKDFTVYVKNIGPEDDKFVGGELSVSTGDNQIAACAVEKKWTTNGVQFEFTVSAAYRQASRFRVWEAYHQGKQPHQGYTGYWFYLRDFATNNAPISRQIGTSEVAPEIIQALPKRVRALRPGTPGDMVWKQLNLAAYQHCLSNDNDDLKGDRYRLSWNYAIEFTFETTTNDSTIDALEKNTNNYVVENTRYGKMTFFKDNRKLIRAVLYKNGEEVCHSRK
jgi:hypothetical protein